MARSRDRLNFTAVSILHGYRIYGAPYEKETEEKQFKEGFLLGDPIRPLVNNSHRLNSL